jgi:hypothetical protein
VARLSSEAEQKAASIVLEAEVRELSREQARFFTAHVPESGSAYTVSGVYPPERRAELFSWFDKLRGGAVRQRPVIVTAVSGTTTKIELPMPDARRPDIDRAVDLSVTPTRHLTADTIDLEIAPSLIERRATDGATVFSTRKVSTTLRISLGQMTAFISTADPGSGNVQMVFVTASAMPQP